MNPQVCVISIGLTSKTLARELGELELPAEFVFKEMLLHSDSVLPEDIHTYDVLFSSGNNAKMLKKKTSKPIITIEPSLYDILTACSKAKEFTSTPTVIIHRDTFSAKDIEQLTNILSVNINMEFYEDTDEQIELLVLRCKEDGCRCIIGSGLVCHYAEKHSIRNIYLFPNESIRHSLKTAANMALSISQQNSWNLQLGSIINNSKQGILFMDQYGTVFLCNPVALQYLHTTMEEVIGKKLDFYFSKTDVHKMYASENTNRIFCDIKGQTLLVNIIPVIARQKILNLLLYIDDVKEIQNTERAIRRETWAQKGFTAKYTFEKYHSVNQDFLSFLSLAKNFAKTDEPILIMGETGSGKEVLAQSIHNCSPRAGKAFVAVNCAAISESLLESELFGYSEGAFTGALKGGKEGYFEMAHQGTIFLDEIGEMSTALQSKLLRVIQEKQVLRVGGNKLVPFDTRIIVATNRNLWDLVQSNTFREDLYYRLDVLQLEIPPLRTRKEDIIPLFLQFLEGLSPAVWNIVSLIAAELEKHLSKYSWPGNIRELKNFTHTLVASIRPEDPPLRIIMLIAESLKRKQLRFKPEPITEQPLAEASIPAEAPVPVPVMDMKTLTTQKIKETLDACNGNIPQAARLLGMHRSTLWRRVRNGLS